MKALDVDNSYPQPDIDFWTGILLTPSYHGEHCLGNGEHEGDAL